MMKFKDLCAFFETVKQTNKPTEKSKVITTFFNELKTKKKDDIFSVLRLIVPKLDRDRKSYNMKESKIARVLIKLLALPDGHDKNVLTKSYLMSGQASDFGDVVYSVIRKYLSNHKTTLTIQELNQSLEDLTNRTSESEAEDILMKIFKKCAPEDIKWVIKIILKDLKLGIDANRILNCFHKDGASFYSKNNNLKKVCEVLSDPNVNLHELEIEIFEAFRPMLSKRIDAKNFKKEFQDNKLYFRENKFDGERFQLHMQNNEFRYFSRNGFNYTDTFGENYDTGIFTPKLKELFNKDIKKIILDGEMMLWHTKTKKFGSKGMSLDVKKLASDKTYQPCFCVYDIILINEKILTNRPLKERLKILEKVFVQTKPNTLILSEVKHVRSRQEIIDELNLAVQNHEEGIIIKDPNSIYKYSDRNSGWYKLKLEYFQGVMNDLDLILMGATYASTTSDTLNSFIVGVRSGNANNGKPLYLAFGKVASGLNNDELEFINKKIKSEGHKIEDFSSENLLFGKEKPNYYIEPENSVLFEVRATELTRSTDNSFKTPYVLRFPRIMKIRYDKPVDECLTINELLELCNSNKYVIKLNKRNITLEEILATKTRNVKKAKVIIPKFQDTAQISDLLEGYNIYVFNGNDQHSKDDIENIIQRAGGSLCYRLDDKVDIVLAGTYTPKLQQITSKRNKYDVINVKWLQRVIRNGDLLGYDTEEIYGIGCNYKNNLADEVDMFGDHYTKFATVESLKHCFSIINNLGEACNMNGTIVFKTSKDFSQYVAYFDKHEVIEDNSSNIIYDSFLDELEFRFYNGVVSKTIDGANMIIYNGKTDRENILKNHLSSIGQDNVELKSREFLYQQQGNTEQ